MEIFSRRKFILRAALSIAGSAEQDNVAHSAAQANQFSICNEKGGVEAQQNDQVEGPTLADLQVYQTCAIVFA